MNKIDNPIIKAVEKKHDFRENKIVIFLNAYFTSFLFLTLLFILTLSILFILLPKYNQSKEIDKQKIEKESENNTLRNSLRQLKNLDQLYNTVNQDEAYKIFTILPNRGKVEDLLGQVEAIIKKNGYNPSAIKVEDIDSDEHNEQVINDPTLGGLDADREKVKVPSEVGKIRLGFSLAVSNYRDFKRVLDSVEKNMRLIDVYSLSYSANDGVVAVKAYTYYLK